MDIAVVGAGVSVTLDAAGVCTDARVVLGAVAPTALLVADAARRPDRRARSTTRRSPGSTSRGARACKPIDDKRGTIEYRTKVAGVLARRAAAIAFERARERSERASMSKHHVSTTINGEPIEFLCEPQQTLLDVLRDELRLTGSKEGCGSGDCGACSVIRRRPPGLLVPDAGGRGRRPRDRDHRGHGAGR